MKDSASQSQTSSEASIQVICLGSAGGPSEHNATGLLVRSTASQWSKGSLLAVDAGSHLAAITEILGNHFPLYASKKEGDDTILSSGPFAGLSFPHASARANAVHVVREHVATYLITHPHLDHLSAFAINTAAFHNTSRPKRLAALPFTVNAIKKHIFNDVIWPNLTDEDSGVGFVTFQRLTEGGNLALGEGESRGYIEVCDGLAVKGFRVSHGTCASNPPMTAEAARRSSIPPVPETPFYSHSQASGSVRTPIATDNVGRRSSIFSAVSQPSTPTTYVGGQASPSFDGSGKIVDSSAFFIRAEPSGREVLIFGDVEPDGISMFPRTHVVWNEAATKIVSGSLAGVFIECSYRDSQPDNVLFGHLAPRHLINELAVLADMVIEKRSGAAIQNLHHSPEAASAAAAAAAAVGIKRKRTSIGIPGVSSLMDDATGKRRREADLVIEETSPLPARLKNLDGPPASGPLKDLRVVVIHVKDNMADGEPVSDGILMELKAHEARLQTIGKGLGCEFAVTSPGQSHWF